MKGFVPTPPETVDVMVARMFRGRTPRPDDTILDPGCGTGEFIDGIIRWCDRQGIPLPHITGIESDPRHLPILFGKYKQFHSVHIVHADFLTNSLKKYNFIIGNPPYVAITALTENEKARYRANYSTARGRFDLYMLFFEQALRSLAQAGKLVFITPEKYLYVESAGILRSLLAHYKIEEIHLVSEETFGDLVTYPTITILRNAPREKTCLIHRDGSMKTVTLPLGQHPWLPFFEGAPRQRAAVTLGDVCLRISCGVATGADSVFVQPAHGLDPALQNFARPTIAGRELTPETTKIPHNFVMLIPYNTRGRLLSLEELNEFGRYLSQVDVRHRLLLRTCIKKKPWYAFHETPMLRDILRPKILCKDICETPHFWMDRCGHIIPRHSVYYLVPKNPEAIDVIANYLESRPARRWLAQHCQRASKGFLRLQSHVLQRLPLPKDIVEAALRQTGVHTALCPRHMESAFTG
jgi:tRNA1(Val) A37 N6-methylase TrmN6